MAHMQEHGVIPGFLALFLRFLARPYPWGWGADVADDRLPALGDVDMLNRHLLLSAASVPLERLDLSRERAGEVVENVLGAVLSYVGEIRPDYM
jgi:hypothetical protein